MKIKTTEFINHGVVNVGDLPIPFDMVLNASALVVVITFVCRSKFFGFPDYISVGFNKYPTGESSLSVFSRSRFGVYDFGKNKKRVTKWLKLLDANT